MKPCNNVVPCVETFEGLDISKASLALKDHNPYDASLVVPIIYYILLAIEIVVLLAFWQLVRSGVIDKILSANFFFPQLTVGLFDDSEIIVNDEENSAMERLPSVKMDPKDKTLSTAEDSAKQKEQDVINKTQIVEVTDEVLNKPILKKAETKTKDQTKEHTKSLLEKTPTSTNDSNPGNSSDNQKSDHKK